MLRWWFLSIWLTERRTALLQKDKSKGNISNSYRSIAQLSLMWKLLSGVIADQIYGHFDQKRLLPEEQKDAGKDLKELMIYFILIGQ